MLSENLLLLQHYVCRLVRYCARVLIKYDLDSLLVSDVCEYSIVLVDQWVQLTLARKIFRKDVKPAHDIHDSVKVPVKVASLLDAGNRVRKVGREVVVYLRVFYDPTVCVDLVPESVSIAVNFPALAVREHSKLDV